MSLSYLLDTNAVSEPLRPSPNPYLLRRIQQNEGRIAIASVVWHELLYGCWRLPESRRREVSEQFLFEVVGATIPILSYDIAAAQWHATERARLVQAGRPPSFANGQIVAIAAVQGLILVTANTSDFSDFQSVQTENWLIE